MKNKTTGALIIFLTVATVLMCICTFSLLAAHGNIVMGKLLLMLAIDVPLALLIVLIDSMVIKFTHRHVKGQGKRIVADVTLTALLMVVGIVAASPIATHVFAYKPLLLMSLPPAVLWNLIMTMTIEMCFYYREQVETTKKLAEMEKALAEHHFRRLKEQINPHFLFNSLNTIAALAYEDADKTNRFAKKMSSVYRYLLMTQDKPKVELSEELLFVDNYLYLEQIRFDGMLKVERDYTHKPVNAEVIPASIQMLVENAIKHNINTRESPLTISIIITEAGVTVKNNVQLRQQIHGNGIGLKNLRQQYQLMGKEIKIDKDGRHFIVFIPFA